MTEMLVKHVASLKFIFCVTERDYILLIPSGENIFFSNNIKQYIKHSEHEEKRKLTNAKALLEGLQHHFTFQKK